MPLTVATVSVVPLSVLKVPPPLPSVILRDVVNVALVSSVPPLKGQSAGGFPQGVIGRNLKGARIQSHGSEIRHAIKNHDTRGVEGYGLTAQTTDGGIDGHL
jgi:hypothetical protein